MTLATKAPLSDQCKWTVVYDADGSYDGTATMVDMRDFENCLVVVLGASVTHDGTNFITGFKIVSNTTSAGAGTDHDIIEGTHAEGTSTDITLTGADYGTAAPSTQGDQMMYIEVKADDMYAGDRYIGAVLAGSGTVDCVLIYVQYNGNHNTAGMIQSTRTMFQYNGDV